MIVFALPIARASADESTAPDRLAVAEALFQEGKKLMLAGDFDHACEKLAESEHLDPAGGTVLTLGLCHEAQGKTASAWAELEQASSLAANGKNPEREAVARQHLDALAPKLMRLTIRLSQDVASLPQITVKRDGDALGRAAWGLAVPVDPGHHTIEVSAPGRLSWIAGVDLEGPGSKQIIAIEALSREPPPAPPPAPPRPELPRVAGFVAIGVGAVSLGFGMGFGADAIARHAVAKSRCPSSPCADHLGLDANEASGRSANIATAFAVGGLLASAAGIYLSVGPPSRARPSPQVSLGVSGLRLSGRF